MRSIVVLCSIYEIISSPGRSHHEPHDRERPHTNGIVLTNTSDNVVTVTGEISVSSGIALQGKPGAAYNWAVQNDGTIVTAEASRASTALFLGSYTTNIATGSVVNRSTGLISGSGYGVFVNAATGASVTNDAGGTIAGGAFKAIYISGGLGTIVNAGVLLGGNVAVTRVWVDRSPAGRPARSPETAASGCKRPAPSSMPARSPAPTEVAARLFSIRPGGPAG